MASYYSEQAHYLRNVHQHAGAAWREIFNDLPTAEAMLKRAQDILSWGITHAPASDQFPHELHYGDSVPKRDIRDDMKKYGINADAVREILLNVNDPRHWRKYFFAVSQHLIDESEWS